MGALLIALAALALVAGAINLPELVTLERFLEPVVGHSEVPAGLTAWVLVGLALVAAAGGILVAASLYLSRAGSLRRRILERRLGPVVVAARNKFYVDELYGVGVVRPGKAFATFCTDFVDRRIVDGAVNGTASFVARIAEGLRHLQTGYVRNYAAIFLVGVVVITSFLLTRGAV